VISLFLLERVKNKHPKNPVNPVKKKLGDVVDYRDKLFFHLYAGYSGPEKRIEKIGKRKEQRP